MKLLSIVMPIAVTALVSKKKKSTKKPISFKDIVEVKHYIKGRTRYSIPSLVNNEKDIETLELVLIRVSGIERVRGSAVTGSLTVDYSDIDPSMITGILIQILNLHTEIDKPVASRIQKEVIALGSALNRGVYEKTNGLLDLRSLTSMGIGTIGVFSIIKNRSAMLPGAWTMLWWAYNSALDIKRDIK